MTLLEGEVRFHTEPNGRLVLEQAPPVARISLQALQQFDQRLVRISGNVIRFADQVAYRVAGWDADQSALLLEREAGGAIAYPGVQPTDQAVTAPDWDGPLPHTTV